MATERKKERELKRERMERKENGVYQNWIGQEKMKVKGAFFASEESLRQIICTIFLAACAVQDLRRRKISVRLRVFAGLLP